MSEMLKLLETIQRAERVVASMNLTMSLSYKEHRYVAVFEKNDDTIGVGYGDSFLTAMDDGLSRVTEYSRLRNPEG